MVGRNQNVVGQSSSGNAWRLTHRRARSGIGGNPIHSVQHVHVAAVVIARPGCAILSRIIQIPAQAVVESQFLADFELILSIEPPSPGWYLRTGRGVSDLATIRHTEKEGGYRTARGAEVVQVGGRAGIEVLEGALGHRPNPVT